MTLKISNQSLWQDVFRQQAISNVERWINVLESSEASSAVALEDYDNILRAIEFTLKNEELFELSIQLINLSFSATYNFADWDRWNVYLNAALAQSRQLNDFFREATLSEKLGDLHVDRNRNKEAKQYYQQSLEIYKRLGLFAQYANILTKLGQLHRLSGKPETGLELCLEALKIAESLNDKEIIATTELGLSSIYLITKEWELVLNSSTRSYHLFMELKNLNHAARALNNRFIAWFRLDMWDEIGNKPEELINELKEIGDVYILAKLKLNLGVFTAAKGDYKGAELYYLDALDLATQNQVPHDVALVSNNLGVAYTKLGDWESAEEMLFKSIAIYRELDDINSLINSMDNLALLYEAQGKTAVASQTLSDAISLSTDQDLQPHIQSLLKEMQERLDALNPP